jgi:hypothetical protein
LAALPPDEIERLLPNFQQISFSLGDVVYESSGHLDYVYFPTTAIISLLYTMENGSTAEMGLTGNDGVVGIALFMGGGTMPNRAVVQSAGDAIRMKAKVLQAEFASGGEFQRLLLRYTQALITQISQTAVCNRLHSVEQQLCRWLLLSHDRVDTDELIMTQELIAICWACAVKALRWPRVTFRTSEQSVMCGAAYRSWTARNWKIPHASVTELSKTSLIGYSNNRRAILSQAVFITAELPSFPSTLLFEVSTLPIASFARLKTVRLFSKNTLSHSRLVVCGK